MNHNMRKMFTEQQIADLVSKGIKDGEIKLPQNSSITFDVVLNPSSDTFSLSEENGKFVNESKLCYIYIYDNSGDNKFYGFFTPSIEEFNLIGYDDTDAYQSINLMRYSSLLKEFTVSERTFSDITVVITKII